MSADDQKKIKIRRVIDSFERRWCCHCSIDGFPRGEERDRHRSVRLSVPLPSSNQQECKSIIEIPGRGHRVDESADVQVQWRSDGAQGGSGRTDVNKEKKNTL